MKSGRVEKAIQVRTEPDTFFCEKAKYTYGYLRDTVKLASTLNDLLLMQSVPGWMINGYGEREDPKKVIVYPNAICEDVYKALGLHIGNIHRQRQDVIDDIVEYFNRALDLIVKARSGHSNGNNCIKLVNKNMEPLGGIKLLEGTLIHNPENVIMGAYIGSRIDNAEWRGKTEKAYGIQMHKGESHPIHFEKLKDEDLTLEDLASLGRNHLTSVAELTRKQIITPKTVKYSSGYVNGYVELQAGYGVSDDAGFLATCLLFGIEAGIGFLLVDAIDTWDKSVSKIMYGGQDEHLGPMIKERYESIKGKGSFPVTEEDVLSVIYLAAIEKEYRKSYPSCSQRRFVQIVQIDPFTGLCPIESHLTWVRAVKEGGYIPPSMNIAFQQVQTHKFYGAFRKRYNELAESGKLRRAFNLPSY